MNRPINGKSYALPVGEAGQPDESIVMAHQVRILSKDRLVSSYGRLESEDLRRQVRAILRLYLDVE